MPGTMYGSRLSLHFSFLFLSFLSFLPQTEYFLFRRESASGLLYNWDGMEDGTCDVSLEVWDEGREEEIGPFVGRRALSRIGSLGVIGRNGWFMTKYAVDEIESYASYRPFARADMTLVLDNVNTTGELGELGGFFSFPFSKTFSLSLSLTPRPPPLTGTAPSWLLSTGARSVIENLNLQLEWVDHPSESDYLAIWDEHVLAQQFYLFTYWEPTQIFTK